MEAASLRNKLHEYIDSANDAQLQVFYAALGYDLTEAETTITVEEYNKEIDDAEREIDNGDFYTHDEVSAISKDWVNGK